MKTCCQIFLGILLLVSWCEAATNGRNNVAVNPFFHNHTDLDVVQCNHAFYKINPFSGKPEIESSQESRVDPSRQYLPLPDPSRQYLPQPDFANQQKIEEDPAATFEQPNVLPIQNTLLSPNLQSNYNSLFNQKNKPDSLSPAAANIPSSVLAPVPPKKTSNKKHSDEDDENNLERLCNDAFHSFLCKPIKGPRKTPTGRLRQNAVLPPDILAGFSSNQDPQKVLPNKPGPPQGTFNNVGYSLPQPTKEVPPLPKPSNQFPKVLPFPKPISTPRQPQQLNPFPTPFTNILKNVDPANPLLPSPTDTDFQILKPKSLNSASLKGSAQTSGYTYEKPDVPFAPEISSPSSNKYIDFATQKPYYPTITIRPSTKRLSTTPGYAYDKPNIPFPSNNVPQIIQSPESKIHKPDCDNKPTNQFPVIANPSNETPYVFKPFTRNVFTSTMKPVTTFPGVNPSRYNQIQFRAPSKSLSTHDCELSRLSSSPFANPGKQNLARAPFQLQPQTKAVVQPDGNKVPSASNNNAQILAQPQEFKPVTISPQKSSGYFYEKPAKPFIQPVSYPTIQNPVVTQQPTERPFKFQPISENTDNGYNYDQPRIPFPSNNIAQIISQSTVGPPSSTTPAASVPCEHDKSVHSSPIQSNPTNQNNVIINADTSSAYIYSKPNPPFLPQSNGLTKSSTTSFKSFTTTSKPFSPIGYSYEKPVESFPLPNPTNNIASIIASSANNGYNYQKPVNPFSSQTIPSSERFGYTSNSGASTSTTPKSSLGYSYERPRIPFPSEIRPKVAVLDNNQPGLIGKPQTQIEVTIRPGYSYNKPSSFVPPQPTNDRFDVEGYSYPKPSIPFIR